MLLAAAQAELLPALECITSLSLTVIGMSFGAPCRFHLPGATRPVSLAENQVDVSMGVQPAHCDDTH